MEWKFIDAHTHLNFPEFDHDREETIERAKEAGVGMINVGTDLKTSHQVVKLAEKYPDQMWAIVGVHPNDNKELPTDEEWQELKTLAQNKKVVAIGECGLDYFRSDESTKEIQKELFQKQIDLAREVEKPLMLHVRSSSKTQDAYLDVVAILKENKDKLLGGRPGDVHFFAGDMDIAKEFLDLGFTLSFTGVITFTTDYDEVIRYVPMDRLLIETDAPYVAPMPHRGQRNEPAYVVAVAKKMALIKDLPVSEVEEALLTNAKKLFNLG